ncbi:sodium:proton antiporter NhaD [uncultured Thalassolituus sp.]|uniref:sodium:proton antiporter NhaD n=1 Tax=uncultured Thalassolituus sp. TaxID=285273 RepID=UPI002620F0D3|nr:sodium:proton antiporter NhaD [uncultured Thalassolituus sp.]
MPEILNWIIIALALTGLLAVIFEEIIHINKAQSVLFLGTLSWVLLFATSSGTEYHQDVMKGLEENIGEIAGLWLFLTAAMTFVAYLNKKGLIENLIYKFLPEQMTERGLLLLTGLFAFGFSSLADNITATLISVALILSLNLPAQKKLRFAAVVVFAVNSGGVAMITGDVTTLMIFLEGKVSITNLLFLSLPALTAVLALIAILMLPLNAPATISYHNKEMQAVDLTVAGIFLSTILTTIILNVAFDVPPVLTFLTGLSVMFLVAKFMGQDTESDPIMDYIRRIEFDTLMFFLGILLIVGALKEIHALESFVRIYDYLPAWQANFLMGLISSIIDNVPLTAALLKSDVTMSPAEWLALTYAVGVGGSLLIIGSAAGIVAMSKIEELTFGSYLRFIVALLAAYSLGYGLTLALGNLL